MIDRLNITDAQLADFCSQHQIRRLAFFGSVLRDDFSPTSDVDVLVEFEPEADRRLTYFTLAQVELDLQNLLHRTVDLALPTTLDKRLRDRIIAAAEVRYDAA